MPVDVADDAGRVRWTRQPRQRGQRRLRVGFGGRDAEREHKQTEQSSHVVTSPSVPVGLTRLTQPWP
jgi:hypothetical protein